MDPIIITIKPGPQRGTVTLALENAESGEITQTTLSAGQGVKVATAISALSLEAFK